MSNSNKKEERADDDKDGWADGWMAVSRANTSMPSDQSRTVIVTTRSIDGKDSKGWFANPGPIDVQSRPRGEKDVVGRVGVALVRVRRMDSDNGGE